MVIPRMQWLATQKIIKNREKPTAKCHFYFSIPPFFCQNAPKTTRFFCQYYCNVGLILS